MILIGGKAYEIITDHKNGWNQEVFRERYSEVLDRYDYIVGDWGYSQLRLRGFYKDNSPKATKESSIAVLQDYLNEYCNFGCAYFIIERIPGKNQEGDEGADFTDEASLREETTAAQEDMPKYTVRSQPAPERAPRPQQGTAAQGDRQAARPAQGAAGPQDRQQGQQGGNRSSQQRGGGGAAQGQHGQRPQGAQHYQQGGRPQGQQQGGRPQGQGSQRDHSQQQQNGQRPNNPAGGQGQQQSQRAQVSSQGQGSPRDPGQEHNGQRSHGHRQHGHNGSKGQPNRQQAAPNATGRDE